jgi:hypothetical protein
MSQKIRTQIPNSFKVKRKDIDTRYLLVTDTSGDLVNIHYKDNINETWNDFYNGKRRFCPYSLFRGWVVDVKNNKVVGRSFSKTKEVVIPSASSLLNNYPMYYEGLEGTIIRVFKHNDKLYKSTHKKLNIENSRWGNNKTFSQQFEEALMNYPKFDIESTKNGECHVFILVHPENQIINREKVTPSLYHLDTWITSKTKRNGVKIMKSIYEKTTLNIPKPKELTHGEAVKVLEKGGFVITPGNTRKLKIMTDQTAKSYEIRGNEFNLFKRWFDVGDFLKDVVSYVNREVVEEFPKMYEEYLNKCIDYIWKLYKDELSMDVFKQSPIYIDLAMYLKECNKHLSHSDVSSWVKEYISKLDSSQCYQFIVAQNKKITRLEKIKQYNENKIEIPKLEIPDTPMTCSEGVCRVPKDPFSEID